MQIFAVNGSHFCRSVAEYEVYVYFCSEKMITQCSYFNLLYAVMHAHTSIPSLYCTALHCRVQWTGTASTILSNGGKGENSDLEGEAVVTSTGAIKCRIGQID